MRKKVKDHLNKFKQEYKEKILKSMIEIKNKTLKYLEKKMRRIFKH